MTACRPVPLKILGCDSDGDGEGSFFAISNELRGFCHTEVQIQAVTMKIMMFLMPLVMATTVVLVAAAAAVATTATVIACILAPMTKGIGT